MGTSLQRVVYTGPNGIAETVAYRADARAGTLAVDTTVTATERATVGATLIGTLLAFCLARVDVPGKTVLLTLATLPSFSAS